MYIPFLIAALPPCLPSPPRTVLPLPWSTKEWELQKLPSNPSSQRFYSILTHKVQRYSATSDNMKLDDTGRRWVGCCVWYSEDGMGCRSPPRPIAAVPNTTANVPTTVSLYNSPLLCGFLQVRH